MLNLKRTSKLTIVINFITWFILSWFSIIQAAPIQTVASAQVYERFAGIIVDQQGRAVSGALVKINGIEKQSINTGFFEIYAPRVNRYTINVTKNGYALVSQIENNLYGNPNLKITMNPAKVISINPALKNDVSDSSDGKGTMISLPANALVDANNKLPNGNIYVSMRTYNLADESMPGDMSGISSAGQSVYLESAGAVWAEFTDAAGKKYNLASGKKATISIPAINTESTVGLWSYDELKGTWLKEGSANLLNGRFQGEVSHFSAWNFDWEKITPACVKLDIDQSFYTANKDGSGNLTIKAVVTAPNQSVRIQTLFLGTNAVIGSPHVLYNLPINATVNFYATPSSSTPYTTIFTGTAWGGMGVPSAPYDVCNGKVRLSSPMINPPDSEGYAQIVGMGKGVPFSWKLICKTMTYSGNPTTPIAVDSVVATMFAADMISKGAPVGVSGSEINIGNCSLYVGQDAVTDISKMCLVTAGGCAFNPWIKLISKLQKLTTIKGAVFNDLNGNKLQDSNETGLQGWTVFLKRPDGTEIFKTTDSNGYYEFPLLLTKGNYSIFTETRPNFITLSPQPINRTIDFVNVPKEVNFSIQKSTFVNLNVSKTGTGTIVSSPIGINCGTDCTEAYAVSTKITLTATPETGFKFVNWTGSCTGTTASTVVTMDVAKNCVANFVSSSMVTSRATTYPTKVCKGKPFEITFGVDTTRNIGTMQSWLQFNPTNAVNVNSATNLVTGGQITALGNNVVFRAIRSSSTSPPVIKIPVGTTNLFKVNFTANTTGTILFNFNPQNTWSKDIVEIDSGIYEAALPDPLTQTNLGLQLTVENC